MGKEILIFGNIEIEKSKFYRHKTPIFLRDIDIKKALVSNKISFGEKNYKYFIGNKVKPLNIMLSKTSTYVKSYADIKKEFDSETVYSKEFLKTKIRSHGNEVIDFNDKKIPKVDSNHTCLAVISLDSALKKDDKKDASMIILVIFLLQMSLMKTSYQVNVF